MIVMSLYTAGRDPEYFPDPDSFCPERWIRNSKSKLQSVLQPHAFIPFGVGVRSCIGRRVAELQMQLLLSRVFIDISWHFLPSSSYLLWNLVVNLSFPLSSCTCLVVFLTCNPPSLVVSLISRPWLSFSLSLFYTICLTFRLFKSSVSRRQPTERWASSYEWSPHPKNPSSYNYTHAIDMVGELQVRSCCKERRVQGIFYNMTILHDKDKKSWYYTTKTRKKKRV